MKYFFRDSCSFPYIKTPLKVSDPAFDMSQQPKESSKSVSERLLMNTNNSYQWSSEQYLQMSATININDIPYCR